MPRLYIEAYTRALSGKTVCVACRQGILRDYFREIVADIKFLDRQGIRTILYHNMPNRFANQKVFREMGVRLPETEVERVLPDDDFYRHVLDREKRVHKLVFIERKALMDRQGHIINAITTPEVRAGIRTRGDWIANVNFKGALERICDQIDARQYDRVHILPAGKHSIKHELFTIEGHGTLIANNYVECFKPMGAKEDMRLVDGILRLYRSQGFLKRRTNEYLREHRKNFYVTLIDGIVVGCVEKKNNRPPNGGDRRFGHLHQISQPTGGGVYDQGIYSRDAAPQFFALHLLDQQSQAPAALGCTGIRALSTA
jgi:amino-acid N-acetyltransferase